MYLNLFKLQNNFFDDYYTEKDFIDDLNYQYYIIYSKNSYESFTIKINMFLENIGLLEYYGFENNLDYHIDYLIKLQFVYTEINSVKNNPNILKFLRLEYNNLNTYIFQLVHYSKINYR